MAADEAPLNSAAGLDRVTILPGKTYLRGWAGYGSQPKPPVRGRGARVAPPPPTPTGPAFTTVWSKEFGPGWVTFADPKALITTATSTSPGADVRNLTAANWQTKTF